MMTDEQFMALCELMRAIARDVVTGDAYSDYADQVAERIKPLFVTEEPELDLDAEELR